MTAWPTRASEQARLEAALATYPTASRPLPGVASAACRQILAKQMVASLRRRDYRDLIRNRPIDPKRADPDDRMFDPERAAVLHARAGRSDEAVWLTFLATHFGKHRTYGWSRVRDVYSGLDSGVWTWDRVRASPGAFRVWLGANAAAIGGGFGNHRKYESLVGARGTGAVAEDLVTWVGPGGSLAAKFADLVREGGNDPNTLFDHMYRSFNVARFGRLGRFDFLSTIGRLGILPIEPGSAYLDGATGPLRGARLLFSGTPDAALAAAVLEEWLLDLDRSLRVGMEVMEDSLCNWQKSPGAFIHFRG